MSDNKVKVKDQAVVAGAVAVPPVSAIVPDSGIDIEVPDIPLPEAGVDATIKDKASGAFKFAFIGSGHGGSRIAQAFHALGYARVCAINTAAQDLATINIPEANKLVLGGGGAGKDPAVAFKIFKEKKEDVLDLMRRSFGPVFDRVFICVGAGGGTGGGTVVPLVDTVTELMASLRVNAPVGVIVALPKNAEGRKVALNAIAVIQDLMALVAAKKVSPLIVMDNERIAGIYPGLAVDPFWSTANKSIASLFHLFNNVASKESHYTAFDPTDYKSLLDSGLIVFGATPVAQWQDATGISYAVRDNLQRNMLAGGIDLSTGTVAGAVVIGGQHILSQVPQENLDHAFEQLSRIMKGGNTVHQGIYRGDKDNLVVYTMIGGLAAPELRMAELQKIGGV